MKFLLFLIVIWSSLFSAVFSNKDDFKYIIKINNVNRGVLYIKSEQDYTNSRYYGISKNDKILFYAKNKNFILSKSFNNITLQKLNIGDIENKFLYDLTSVSEEILEESGLSKVDFEDSAIILDTKENLPVYTLIKLPIHTMDSLLKTLFFDNSILKKEFYLYEPQNAMLIKVAFSDNDTKKIKISNKKIKTNIYTLSIVGKNKKLLNLYMSSVPLRIEANSKKWSFDLIGAGKEKKITINKVEQVKKLLKKNIRKTYESKYNLSKINIEFDDFYKTYTVSYNVSKSIDKSIIKDYLPIYISNYKKYKKTKDLFNDEYFTYEVDFTDVIKDIEKEKDIDIVDSKFYWKEINVLLEKRIMQRYAAEKMDCTIDKENYEKVVCNKKDTKDIDLEAMTSLYLKEKYTKYDYENVEVKEESKKYYNLKTNEKTIISSTVFYKGIRNVFAKEFENLDLRNFDIVKNNKDKVYRINISKKDVSNATCVDYLKSINLRRGKVEYKNKKCYLKQNYKYEKSYANSLFNKYLTFNYPDLEYIDVEKKINGNDISFLYLDLEIENIGAYND